MEVAGLETPPAAGGTCGVGAAASDRVELRSSGFIRLWGGFLESLASLAKIVG